MPVGKTKLSEGGRNWLCFIICSLRLSPLLTFLANLVLLQGKSDTLRTGEGVREPRGARVGEALRVAKWG